MSGHCLVPSIILRRALCLGGGATFSSLSQPQCPALSVSAAPSAAASSPSTTRHHPDPDALPPPLPEPVRRSHDAKRAPPPTDAPSAPPPPPPPPASAQAPPVTEKELPKVDEQPPRPEPTLHRDELNTLLRHPALYDPVLAPRFPIVLCHGLYGFDVRGPTFFRLHYWGDLLKILRGKVGAEVFVTAVPGTGAVKDRARVLHEGLQSTEGVRGRDLNFIAHSMGGLDARYLFSNIQPSTYHPRSLTTLSTPHRGSEFMSWCRANIGIGTDFDKTSETAARVAHEADATLLPFSLKAPILSRAQQDAQDRADEVQATKDQIKASAFAALPTALSASISGYLLDLLDSPAYANLTPSFLRDVFNPGTPDRPDIRYFSVAARTDRISIWHPLWLPKLVLDGAEAARVAQGVDIPPANRGNDGLVTVESAKWGEFLGTLEGCDHWELRGSSGLSDAAASAKAVAEATNIASTAEVDRGREAKTKPWWSWQDVYALVGAGGGGGTKAAPEVVEQGTVAAVGAGGADTGKEKDEGGLAAIASLITNSLPGGPPRPSPPPPPPPAASDTPPLTSPNPNPRAPAATPNARMLYGAPVSSAAPPFSSTTKAAKPKGVVPPKVKPEKFDLERLTLALCRKLHNEGL